MKAVTAGQMREIDRLTMERYGMSGLVLMERAGVATAARIRETFPGRSKALILAGGGNNGGDGLVIARELLNHGYEVSVVMTGAKGRLSPECAAQMEIVRRMGIRPRFSRGVSVADLHGALVVDAMLGTGLGKDIGGELASLIRTVNASGAPVVAVDVPSGISSDTGQVMGEAVRADVTVTFGAPKIGHFLYPGAEHTGRLFVEDIGFPRELLENAGVGLIDADSASMMMPTRARDSHKGDFGHLLVIGGARGKAGAALMAAKAALRTGAGLVTIGIPESMLVSYTATVREEMLLPLPDEGTGEFRAGALGVVMEFISERADALAIGPGMGRGQGAMELAQALARQSGVPVILDADALYAMGKGAERHLGKAISPAILTPHMGEFARLTGRDGQSIMNDRIRAATKYADTTGAYLVQKGAPTIIAEPRGGAYINLSGTQAMAKGGSGDVLTGVIGAYLAMGLSPLEASLLGTHVHGLAGEGAASRLGMHSVLATDIVESLPGAVSGLQRGSQPWST